MTAPCNNSPHRKQCMTTETSKHLHSGQVTVPVFLHVLLNPPPQPASWRLKESDICQDVAGCAGCASTNRDENWNTCTCTAVKFPVFAPPPKKTPVWMTRHQIACTKHSRSVALSTGTAATASAAASVTSEDKLVWFERRGHAFLDGARTTRTHDRAFNLFIMISWLGARQSPYVPVTATVGIWLL